MALNISLIHPSRERPEMANKAFHNWMSKAGKQVQYFLCLDNDEPKIDKYNYLFSVSQFHGNNIVQSNNRSAVDAINYGAKKSSGDVIVVMSDDFDCPENWAFKLEQELEGKSDFIIKTQDGIQKWIITLPILDRTYYNRFGYVYHPDYLHLFCDTELSCVADLTGRRITSDLMFKHNHYSTGAFEKDAVSVKADSTWSQGEKLFIERARKKFDLVNPPGQITSDEYKNWARSKGIRL